MPVCDRFPGKGCDGGKIGPTPPVGGTHIICCGIGGYPHIVTGYDAGMVTAAWRESLGSMTHGELGPHLDEISGGNLRPHRFQHKSPSAERNMEQKHHNNGITAVVAAVVGAHRSASFEMSCLVDAEGGQWAGVQAAQL